MCEIKSKMANFEEFFLNWDLYESCTFELMISAYFFIINCLPTVSQVESIEELP